MFDLYLISPDHISFTSVTSVFVFGHFKLCAAFMKHLLYEHRKPVFDFVSWISIWLNSERFNISTICFVTLLYPLVKVLFVLFNIL